MSAAAALAFCVAPLDRVRSAALRVLGRPFARFLADREARVVAAGTAGAAGALGAAVLAPAWAFVLGPLVLGVPHVLADLRYLVAQPGLHRRRALAWTVGAPLPATALTTHPAVGLSAALGAVACARAPRARRAAAFAVVAGVVVVASRAPDLAALVLVHAHNAVAVALFAAVFARTRRAALALVAVATAGAAALFAGAFDGALARSPGAPPTALDLDAVASWLAPVEDRALALRLVALFVFAQGVHYAVWLRAVPEEARTRPGLRSFASSARALAGDLGAPVLAGAALVAVAVAVRAAGSLEGARILYLRASAFHAYLEIACAALFLLEPSAAPRARVRDRPASTP